jgi:phosphoserine phosphatase
MSAHTQAPSWPHGQWFPPNHQALTALLQRNKGMGGCAVFDWDNTCIFNDIGDAAFAYQLEHLLFALPLTEFVALGESVDAIAHQPLWADCIAAYASLWPKLAAKQTQSVLQSVAHHDFRAKMGALYEQTAHAPGARAPQTATAYALLAHLWRHIPDDVLSQHVATMIDQQVRAPIGQTVWTSATAGLSGRATWRSVQGLRAYAEMRALMVALQDFGITPYVVSASMQELVQIAVQKLAFPVALQQVFGIRTRTSQSDYPVTYRAGKVTVIRQYLPTLPILVAGDAPTDLEMLEAFEETQIRLLIHRPSQAVPLAKLYTAALQPQPTHGPITLLQGHNGTTGTFIPQNHSSEQLPLVMSPKSTSVAS